MPSCACACRVEGTSFNVFDKKKPGCNTAVHCLATLSPSSLVVFESMCILCPFVALTFVRNLSPSRIRKISFSLSLREQTPFPPFVTEETKGALKAVYPRRLTLPSLIQSTQKSVVSFLGRFPCKLRRPPSQFIKESPGNEDEKSTGLQLCARVSLVAVFVHAFSVYAIVFSGTRYGNKQLLRFASFACLCSFSPGVHLRAMMSPKNTYALLPS